MNDVENDEVGRFGQRDDAGYLTKWQYVTWDAFCHGNGRDFDELRDALKAGLRYQKGNRHVIRTEVPGYVKSTVAFFFFNFIGKNYY